MATHAEWEMAAAAPSRTDARDVGRSDRPAMECGGGAEIPVARVRKVRIQLEARKEAGRK